MSFPLQFRETIEEACDQFEAAWKAVRKDSPLPALADFLRPESDPAYPYLVKELIKLDLEYRARRGSIPQPEDYLCFSAIDSTWLKEGIARFMRAEQTVDYPQHAAGAAETPTPAPDRPRTGRFTPGEVLNDRYRIIAFLGKGGMGEVYRADDLTLGQEVALKFLPEALARDPERLKRFREEVANARRVSHPNVCRVYDIGEVTGQNFLTMEYIDGKDLDAELKKYFRFPDERCRLLASEICSGLVAVHELGIVHRDLKLHNILIDGKGKPRITDFGLAVQMNAVPEQEKHAGTPAYQAPEQIHGEEVTPRTDLYALGVVLYQVATGTHPFGAKSPEQMRRFHLKVIPPAPSTVVPGVSRVMDWVICRCLEKDPAKRPSSAQSIIDDLRDPKGIDDMGPRGVLTLSVGTALFATILVLLVLIPWVVDQFAIYKLTQLSDKPAVLEAKAQQVLLLLGLDDSGVPELRTTFGIERSVEMRPDLDERTTSDETDPLQFWYRQSHKPITPMIPHLFQPASAWKVTANNPPPVEPGMTTLRMTVDGTLLELLAVPEKDARGRGAPPFVDWKELFRLAGLNIDDFEGPVNDNLNLLKWPPPIYADSIRIWRHQKGQDPIEVVVATHRGSVVYFQARDASSSCPWLNSPSISGSTPGSRVDSSTVWSLALFVLVCMAVALPLAVRNLKLGRSDTKGALRFVVYFASIELLLWPVTIPQGFDARREIPLLVDYLNRTIAHAARYWLYYVALEPYVRRFWPAAMVSWIRLVYGRFGNPLVGRDFLIGALVGLLLSILVTFIRILSIRMDAVISGRFLASAILEVHQRAVITGMVFLLVMLLLRVVLHHRWVTIAVFTVLLMATFSIVSDEPKVWAITAVWMFTAAIVLTRFGLLSLMSMGFAYFLVTQVPLTANISAWYAAPGLIALTLLAVLATYAYYISTLADRTLAT